MVTWVSPQQCSALHATEECAPPSTRAAAPATCGRSPRVNESINNTTSVEFRCASGAAFGSFVCHTDAGTRPISARTSAARANSGSVRFLPIPPARAPSWPSRVFSKRLISPARYGVTLSHSGSSPSE